RFELAGPGAVLEEEELDRDRIRLTFHCTLAVTEAVPVIVNVHVFVLFPPLEQAPDQIVSRSFETLSVIDVPAVNDPDPELPAAGPTDSPSARPSASHHQRPLKWSPTSKQ